eukprot:5273511-Alexandrium_andersonii.AAC.1
MQKMLQDSPPQRPPPQRSLASRHRLPHSKRPPAFCATSPVPDSATRPCPAEVGPQRARPSSVACTSQELVAGLRSR